MVSPDQSDGDAEESRARAKALFVVLLVAEDVVHATESGERAGEHHARGSGRVPTLTPPYSAASG